jgi:hypothetical protein
MNCAGFCSVSSALIAACLPGNSVPSNYLGSLLSLEIIGINISDKTPIENDKSFKTAELE